MSEESLLKSNQVRQTSIRAYENEVLPNLGKRQAEVLSSLGQVEPATDKEIASHLNRPINTVTPRRNELVKEELVEEKERRPCNITGRTAIAWGLTNKGKHVADKVDMEED